MEYFTSLLYALPVNFNVCRKLVSKDIILIPAFDGIFVVMSNFR